MKKIETFTLPETRFMSNFYPYKKDGTMYPHKLRIEFEGLVYDCTENAYQASKTLDQDLRLAMTTMNPYETKNYWSGRENEMRPDWDDVKYGILKRLNEQKFVNHPELAEMLLATGNAILEEGNTWGDTYWGICDGVGENNLGKILMEIRSRLTKHGKYIS